MAACANAPAMAPPAPPAAVRATARADRASVSAVASPPPIPAAPSAPAPPPITLSAIITPASNRAPGTRPSAMAPIKPRDDAGNRAAKCGFQPARRRQARRMPRAQPHHVRNRPQAAVRAYQRNRTGARCVPSRVAQDRPRFLMARTVAQSIERRRGSKLVQRDRRVVTLVLGRARVRPHSQEHAEQPFTLVAGCAARVPRRQVDRRLSRWQRPFVRLEHHIDADELIAVP